MKVLVVNAGSSSLKYQLLNTENGEVLAKGICERIGIDGRIEHRLGEHGEKTKREIQCPTMRSQQRSLLTLSQTKPSDASALWLRSRLSVTV